MAPDHVGKDRSNDPIYYLYDADGNLWGLNYYGSVYFYVRNAQNDITGIVDSTGAVVVTYSYDAWGNLLSTTGTLATSLGQDNPFRYRGYYYDTETGLYYLQSRYYNPEWNRFINADVFISTGQGLLGSNMFAYCQNNPIEYVDEFGTFIITITAVSILYVAGAAVISTLAIDLVTRGEDSLPVVLTSAIVSTANSISTEISRTFATIFPATVAASVGVVAYQEHNTNTNKANKEPHEKGQKRKKTDKRGGEKGDGRRPYHKGQTDKVYKGQNNRATK